MLAYRRLVFTTSLLRSCERVLPQKAGPSRTYAQQLASFSPLNKKLDLLRNKHSKFGLGLLTAVVASAGGIGLSQSYNPDRRLEQDSEYTELVQELVGSESLIPLLTTSLILSGQSPVGKDHLFSNLLKSGLVNDIHCFFDADKRRFHTLLDLGPDVCGHPTIVHGGITAAIMDEAFGGLIFCLKKKKVLGPGPPFTVKLEVEYKKPIRVNRNIVCSTEILDVDGRKVWVGATIVDVKSRETYATGKALFVTPKLKLEKPWTFAAWAKSFLMFYSP
uniref:Thioesterase superfamily member 4 n=1 Tax=Tetraselmis sp. GSL018 TaxID=582737 RepID=A0A061RV78_9CHLO|mmetsp:Transcript_291/g.609  ORF Transcript_291/g.609 Transcript_291/m.609 type:complete len:276 (+) Transcript_291:72-899(+)|eukprot:CAMPEP_0177613234 /NCGR_PEP_ID=MMETSP0419_2-20121207/21816_1 /TAXON_ID=582737 /ORGANISM="Tetraselmis sp., Strain GSL018" /LENGTH=275 /DNA_ID=CAMNT_0019109817 /DNA_START=48 /DNA_END=875 /DNA_ORIENTATION=-